MGDCGDKVVSLSLLRQRDALRAARGRGMSSAEPANSYREYAAKCVLLAKRPVSVSERLTLIDMAEAWKALARQAEENPVFGSLCPPTKTSETA